MNKITEIVWDSVSDDEELLAELTRIMRQEYVPFLPKERATTVNTYTLEHFMREELSKWYEWLPDSPINQIGGELAMEAFRCVDWRHRASLVLDRLQLAG
jgi:hypothetical protein